MTTAAVDTVTMKGDTAGQCFFSFIVKAVACAGLTDIYKSFGIVLRLS